MLKRVTWPPHHRQMQVRRTRTLVDHLCRFHFQLISLRCAGEYGSAWPACEAHSRGIALDEAGAHLYVAGTRSGVLRTYTVDESTGRLADCGARVVGDSPVRSCPSGLGH